MDGGTVIVCCEQQTGAALGRLEYLWAGVGELIEGRVGQRSLPGRLGSTTTVAVLVSGGDRAELVAGELGGLLVMDGDLLLFCAGRERAECKQRLGCGGAVEVAVCEDRALVGALRAAVVGVQVLDECRAQAPNGSAQLSGSR